jgi:carbonic anhydrase
MPQLGLQPYHPKIESGRKFEAMILGCIDPRLQQPVHEFAVRRGLIGQYSQFTIAGAVAAVVAPAFAEWHKAFWDNLEKSIHLHGIEKVIAIDHRDCGAIKIAYGDAAVATAETETEIHRALMTEFYQQVRERHPALKVERLLMALDGTITDLA